MRLESGKGVTGAGHSSSVIEYLLLRSPIMKLKRERQELFSCVSTRQYSWTPHPGEEYGLNSADGDEGIDNWLSDDYLSLVAAGVDVISKAFVSTFVLLLRRPGAMDRVKREIDTTFYNGSLSGIPQWEEVSRLRYLDAVLKESIRYQATTSSFKISVPAGGTIIAGHYLPAGTVIEWRLDAFNFDQDIYGEHVGDFLPERWLVADLQRRERMEQGLLAFYISGQSCAAVRVISLELKKVIVMILLQFNVSGNVEFSVTGTNVTARSNSLHQTETHLRTRAKLTSKTCLV